VSSCIDWRQGGADRTRTGSHGIELVAGFWGAGCIRRPRECPRWFALLSGHAGL